MLGALSGAAGSMLSSAIGVQRSVFGPSKHLWKVTIQICAGALVGSLVAICIEPLFLQATVSFIGGILSSQLLQLGRTKLTRRIEVLLRKLRCWLETCSGSEHRTDSPPPFAFPRPALFWL